MMESSRRKVNISWVNCGGGTILLAFDQNFNCEQKKSSLRQIIGSSNSHIAHTEQIRQNKVAHARETNVVGVIYNKNKAHYTLCVLFIVFARVGYFFFCYYDCDVVSQCFIAAGFYNMYTICLSHDWRAWLNITIFSVVFCTFGFVYDLCGNIVRWWWDSETRCSSVWTTRTRLHLYIILRSGAFPIKLNCLRGGVVAPLQ